MSRVRKIPPRATRAEWNALIDDYVSQSDVLSQKVALGPRATLIYLSDQGQNMLILNPYVSKAHVYKGQLHCHTTNSDGVDSPTALMTAYKNAGYDFVAITDHDYLTPDPGVSGILHVPGVEETLSQGHIISLGCTKNSTYTTLQYVLDDVEVDGALAAIAHPLWTSLPNSEETLLGLLDYGLLEIKNSYIDGDVGYNDTRWQQVLSAHKPVWGIAVDDCHNVAGPNFDKAYVEVFADSLTKDAILASLRAGNFYCRQKDGPKLTISVTNTTIKVETEVVCSIRFVGKRGRSLLFVEDVKSASYTIKGHERFVYVRVWVRATDRRSWTQPIGIEPIQGLFGDVKQVRPRDVGARVYHNVAQTIANLTWTALAFNSERWDADEIHDTTTNNTRLTCKSPGKYLIVGNIEFAANDVGSRFMRILLNGGTIIAHQGAMTTPGYMSRMMISTIYSLNIGDYVELQAWQNSGGNLNVNSSGNYSPEFMMQKIG